MVCQRCILAVKQIVELQKIETKNITLGKVELINQLSDEQLNKFKIAIEEIGFELMHSKESIIVDKIKQSLILFYNLDDDTKFLMSYKEFLEQVLNESITKLNDLYFKMQGQTIEQLAIAIRLEKVKELLTYNDYTVKEIAFKLNYSSVAYLSKQFKNSVGITPSEFRALLFRNRKSMDSL